MKPSSGKLAGMPLYDMPLDQLQTYKPERAEPGDFDAFWEETLRGTRAHELNARFVPLDTPLRTLSAYDVTFRGFAGQDVKGWLILPRNADGSLPCVVEFIGYGGGRGHVTDWLTYASAGHAHFVMDTRGQGSAWSRGDTPDPEGAGPQYPGFMTRGILDPTTYYYRRVFADAVRAVETARSFEGIDAARIAVSGGSQGGGITLAVAGLLPDVGLALPDVPFLCHFTRAVTLVDSLPYAEIANYLRIHRGEVERVFATLAYFDGMHFAARAGAETLFSVGLMDDVCPPSTVFAAYNHYAGPKEVRIYPFNRHEGGAGAQTLEKLEFLRARWERP